LLNLVHVVAYRLKVRTSLSAVRRLRAESPVGVFFNPPPRRDLGDVRIGWEKSALLLGAWPVALSSDLPDWHVNFITGVRVRSPERPWWKIPDFNPDLGDIKTVWERSRLDWALAFAQQAVLGRNEALVRMN